MILNLSANALDFRKLRVLNRLSCDPVCYEQKDRTRDQAGSDQDDQNFMANRVQAVGGG